MLGVRQGVAALRRVCAPVLEDLFGIYDPDELEAACSTLFGVLRLSTGDEALHGWTQVVLPMLARHRTSLAAAAMQSIGALGGGDIEQTADAQLESLAADGISPPVWAHRLRSPVTATDLRAYEDPDGSTLLLAGLLSRAGTAAGLVIAIDPEDCGALEEVWMVQGESLAAVLERLRTLGRRAGAPLSEVAIDPGEWRWRAEAAMDAHDVHDADDDDGIGDLFEALSNADGNGPGWRAMAAMLRFWIGQLPDTGKPKPPHGNEHDDVSDMFQELFAAGAFPGSAATSAPAPYLPPARPSPSCQPGAAAGMVPATQPWPNCTGSCWSRSVGTAITCIASKRSSSAHSPPPPTTTSTAARKRPPRWNRS